VTARFASYQFFRRGSFLVTVLCVSFILLDESGDLGFKLDKGSSRFFVVTILFAQSKRPLEKIARTVHGSLRKKFKRVGVLHAYREEDSTRRRLLSRLAQTDCSILAIVLNKEKVYTRLQDEKAVLYNYVTNILLDRLFRRHPISPDQPITLIASQRETNRFLNENFKSYLQRQAVSNHHLILQIAVASPEKEKALQVVDFASWAIFRKFEHGDESYRSLIADRIIEEVPLFP